MSAMTLQQIADRLEIEDVLTRYATAIDTKNWQLLERCFTPDAVVDYTSVGGVRGSFPEIKEWLSSVLPHFPMTQHLVTNKTVAVDGDTAISRCALFNPMGMPDGKGGFELFFDGAYYDDKLVRTSDGWRIRERILSATYSTRLQRITPAGG